MSCGFGPRGYAEHLSRTLQARKIPNPFKPTEEIEVSTSELKEDDELEDEESDIGEAKEMIESELPSWLEMGKADPDPDVRLAVLRILARVRDHENRDSAEEAVRNACAEAGRKDLSWLLKELDE